MPKKKSKKPAKKPTPAQAKPPKAAPDQELSEDELDKASGGTLSPWAVNLTNTTLSTSLSSTDIWETSSLSSTSWYTKR